MREAEGLNIKKDLLLRADKIEDTVHVETFDTGKVENDVIETLIKKYFDLRPAGIIEMLDLQRPIYKQTAAYGHFGRNDLDLPWEKTDKAEILRKEAGLH